ncbi:MAG: hypothetical protein ACREQA_19800 [Candidatus Binatia bacterium]
MAYTSSTVTVGTTDTSVYTFTTGDKEVWITVPHNQVVYVGGSGVTVAAGTPIRGQVKMNTSSDLSTGANINAIADKSTPVKLLVRT